MNATNQNTKTNNKGQSFQDILFGLLGGDIQKKLAMAMVIQKAKEEMGERLQAMGDMVTGSMEVEECPCDNNCGSVQITANFIAMTFTPEGIEVKEGKMVNIISFKK